MSQLWPLTVTVPPNTPATAPLITPWALADANLDYIEIIVPDGNSGTAGIAVYWSGTQIIPWGTDSWLITNNEKIHIPVGSYITISGLAVWAYNTGIFPHTFYLRAHVTYTTTPVVTEAPAIGTTSLLGTDTTSFDESLSPSGILPDTSTADTLGELPAPDLSGENLTALPETII